jgi:hypothetical protein
MSVIPPLVVPILAAPFGVVPLEGAEALNPALCALFSARMRGEGAPRQRSPLCYRGSDDLLDWPDATVRQLTGSIFQGVNSVVNAVNDFSPEILNSFTMQARGWFTVVLPNGRVPATSYPLTAWCGIYCVSAPEISATRADSGLLRIYEGRLGTMFRDATNAAMRLPYTSGHYGWRPVPGQLAVFPASLTHEIAMLRASGQLVLVTVRVRFVPPGQQGAAHW